ncbi:MAG: GGDEF domain-containing protein [Altererythrobacter sp.]|nr:GGDEF domain-containing protein [Altererythrobacter sp.]
MTLSFPAAGRLSDEIYAELVRSVFRTIVPTTIMGVLFIVVGMFVTATNTDAWMKAIVAAGMPLSMERIAILVVIERRLTKVVHDAAALRHVERLFAVGYLTFAALLGLFGVRVVHVATLDAQLVVITLVVGYAAGVAAGAALRPWISISALVLSVLPLVAASSLTGDLSHLILSFTLLLFLAGGVSSLLSRYRLEIDKAQLRLTLASLARQDALTGLGNRLTLEERLVAAARAAHDDLVGLHYIDLDRFKRVNDLHGHLVGDRLLQEVAMRLHSVCDDSAFAVRLGGDEFVVLQLGVGHRDEVELMARRIVRCLSEAFVIEGRDIAVGASVGFEVSPIREAELTLLLGAADSALYSVKHAGGGAVMAAARA